MERRGTNRDHQASSRTDRGRESDDRDSRRGRGDDRGGRDHDRDDRGGRGRDDRGGRSGFTYQRRSAEEVNKRASMGAKDFDSYVRDDIKLWKPNEGANTIRILPPTWPDPKHYGLDIWVHYGVGPDQQAYLCLDKMKGEHCPMCEEYDRARRANEDEEYVNELKPTRRVLFYLVDRDHENEGVQAWAAPWTIDRDITKISVDRKTQETIPLDDPEEGYDVEFDKNGKGLGTKYVGVAIARRSSSLGKSAWLDFAVEHPLPEILEYHSAEHIEKVFGGGGSHKSRRDRDGERDDENRGRSGGRDRGDSDRGSRDSGDRDRGGDRDSRGSDRDDRRGGRSRSEEEELTWDSVHSMTADELDALVEAKKLDINPNKADTDDQLADWICEDLGIKKEESRGRRESSRGEDEKPSDRLRSMRENRRD